MGTQVLFEESTEMDTVLARPLTGINKYTGRT